MLLPTRATAGVEELEEPGDDVLAATDIVLLRDKNHSSENQTLTHAALARDSKGSMSREIGSVAGSGATRACGAVLLVT